MGFLLNWIANVFAFLAAVPFVSFAGVFFLSYYYYKDKKKALKLAMDTTTLLLIASVSSMYNIAFSSGFGFWLILLLFLISAGLLGGLQNHRRGRVDYRRLFRIIWRVGFLVLSVMYLVFFFIGLGKQILQG